MAVAAADAHLLIYKRVLLCFAMLTVGTRVTFSVLDPRVHDPQLAGVIVETPRLATGNYTVLADTILWASSFAREEGNIALTHYELPEVRLTVIPRRSRRLVEAREARRWLQTPVHVSGGLGTVVVVSELE